MAEPLELVQIQSLIERHYLPSSITTKTETEYILEPITQSCQVELGDWMLARPIRYIASQSVSLCSVYDQYFAFYVSMPSITCHVELCEHYTHSSSAAFTGEWEIYAGTTNNYEIAVILLLIINVYLVCAAATLFANSLCRRWEMCRLKTFRLLLWRTIWMCCA